MERRVLYIIYVVMFTIFTISCSENEGIVESYVDVNISTAIETSYLNEGYSRGESSSEVDDDVYDVRYTIELWSGDSSEVIYQAEEVVSTIEQSLTHSFRAVTGEYRLVIFADYIETEGSVSHYDTSNGLDEITMLKDDYTANDQSRDCYGYSEDITISESFVLSGISLKRIMAKMTLADTTLTNVTSGSDISISYGVDGIPNGYNLLKGAVITSEAVTVSYPATSEDNQATLAFDYIFISDPTNYLMTFTVGDKEVSATINFEQNKVTNITATFFEN